MQWKKQFVFLGTAILMFSQASILFAQDLAKKDQSRSNIEEFSSQSGALVEKEFIDIGEFKKCKVKVAKFTDLITNSSTKGVRFELEVKGKYSVDSKIGFLDNDEVEALQTSITILIEKVVSTVPSNYKEVAYTSRSGFQAGCYWSDNKWKGFLKIEKYDKDSYVWFSPNDLAMLSEIIGQARSQLN